MNELKDIKEIVEVQEYSLWWLLGLIAFGVLLLSVAFYLFKNRRRRRKKPTAKALALEKLQNLNYENPKEVVYTFEEQVPRFLNEKNETKFDEIVKALGVYKYKKEIPPFDKKVEDAIRALIKELK